ncbi:TPA: hypothetical protein ACKR13_005772 [Pseudomonas aeruginosa]|uniref:hypothetical protein n=1 Tax=Pseudomonas aeruginosa TaxID=287 RepID=UPI001371DE19|nr:hypothetical protein [Pseudomonas aeruginosa]EKD1544734.1 hypothetical protein [Pseudomonas aeruginosa]EKV8097394.1 hypothetical protein [Pseudomonas aeruginosa]EKW6726990.1 hypothetical protein [Pseudomonas aeruginosa]MBA5012412.1 hypothetical protein [Pseudomonas aeruginosa]MCF3987116.1 hypothetical protein [Pseudomonas aeruginosa]
MNNFKTTFIPIFPSTYRSPENDRSSSVGQVFVEELQLFPKGHRMSGCGLVVHVLYVPDQNFSAIMVTWSEFIKGDGGGLFCGYEVSKNRYPITRFLFI